MTKGEPDEALETFQQALTKINTAKNQDKGILANLYSSIGMAHWYNGNNEMAEEHHLKALQIRKTVFGGSSLEVASSLNDLGLDYVNNDIPKAIDLYLEALKIYQKFFPENHPKIAYAYNNLAIAHRKKKEYAKAMEYLRKIESIHSALYPENHPDRAFLALNIAEVYKEEGAEKIALTFYTKAIDIYKVLFGNNHPEIANIYNELGEWSLEKSKYSDALSHFQNALIANCPAFKEKDLYSNPAIDQSYNPSTLLATLIQKANALEARYSAKTLKFNDLKMALKCLETSDSLINQLRQIKTNKNDKLSLGTLAVEVYQSGVRIALLLAENTLRPRFYNEKAFYFSERSKSAVLAEAIAETKAKHFANIPDSLLEREANLKAEITLLEQKMADPSAKDQLDKLRDKLFTASRSYEQFIKSLETNFPAYFSLKYDVALPTVSDLQKQLSPKTALVSYQIADSARRIYTFVITKKRLQVFDEPLEKEFDKMLKGYRNSILFQSETDFVTSSANLYKQLWPIHFSKNITEVIVVQDSKTGGIPYEALLAKKASKKSNGYAGMDFLLNRYAISYAFSAQLWYNSTKKASESSDPSIFLLAPVKFQKMANLPGTEREVKEIGNMFEAKKFNHSAYIFKDASEQTIKLPLLKNFKYLHFATHGIVNTKRPELSAIFLSPDSTKKAKEDGILYSGEIYNLDIRADLVTLSACETGLGKVSKGEGIIGLTRALLYAGANNMMVSLWTVSDRSTSDLMQSFYSNLLNNPNASYSTNLSQAKKALVQTPDFSAPYYWAAFVLIGK
jgi:CHAT domain-containing protein